MKIIKLVIVGTVLFALAGCYGSPFQKTIVRNDSPNTYMEPEQGKVKLVIIRPYAYSFYGHAVEILVNNISQVSLPNQSFSVLIASPGSLELRGQSGLLGPPSRDIQIEGEAGKVVYLLWKTTTQPNFATGIPIIGLNWKKLTQEEASAYLKNVEYIQPKNFAQN